MDSTFPESTGAVTRRVCTQEAALKQPDTPPIWQRLPQTFRYGLHPVPLGLSLTLGLVLAFADIGLLLSIPLLLIPLRYAVEVFNRTAEGDMHPPELSYRVLVEGYGIVIKMAAMLLLLGLLIGSIASSAGPFLAELTLYFFLIALPACFMVLMLTESLLQAINPLALISTMLHLGWSYLALYGLLFILNLAASNLSDLVTGLGHPELAIAGAYGTMNLFYVIAFHMMGYMIFRKGASFGTVSALATGAENPETHLEQLIQDGRSEAARAELRDMIRATPTDLGLYRRLHNLCLRDQSNDELARNAGDYIRRLLAANKPYDAAEVHADCERMGCQLPRLSDTETLALARAVRGKGQAKSAFSLIKGFHKTHPSSPVIPEAYMLGAQILCEDLERDDLAIQMLQYLQKAFPQHPNIDQAHRYLKTLQSLAQA